MPKTAYIYVPVPSRENLEIGLRDGLWGWRTPTLDRAGARQTVQALEEGDFLLLGHKGPNSRVKPGGWNDATLGRVIITEVTKTYFTDSEPVWPDDDYPERIGITVLDEEQNVGTTALGAHAMECLRLSANKQGAALLDPDASAVAHLAATLPPIPAGPGDQTIDHDGESNAVAHVFVRREQQKLRNVMLAGRAHLPCALCGRTLPSRLIRAAHIKRRSQASPEERLQLANIIPACTLGCDDLFEYGYVYVDDAGIIQAGGASSTTPALEQACSQLAGRTVADYGPHRAHYFASHRALTGN
ncbi:hypothetical protein Salbus254_5905 [Streptomyces albidoflavus]|uniref:HNH endonuclease n=1 Tax=Streptomyces albidoflavus TaxID=1886 RepID=UPI000775994B|nr:HNH endonuclease [Streptomyces albidoflavus]AMM12333.1 hypothetical protein Salbus254_5905 [Streptomyces albidoflavus]